MRATPLKPPISERDSETLLEDLCLALRDVGVRDYEFLTGDKRTIEYVNQVKIIYAELQNRGVQIISRIIRLSEETSWQMEHLLNDCLRYPKVIPFVREKDGIRRRLRCSLCRQAERPIDDQRFGLCDNCLNQVLHAIKACTPISGIVLYRIYNREKWCIHGNPDAVLANYDYEDDYWGWDGWCEQCIIEEQGRRQKSLSQIAN